MSESDAPVCVIGLDGASFGVLDQWTALGAMPHLSRLTARGCRAELVSTLPPVTAPAWTSLTTGVNPGVHGVFDFFLWDPEHKGARVARSGDVPVPRVWDLIGRHGRTVGVYYVPVTYPATPVNGFLVTGMLTPGPGPSMTHPPHLWEDLERRGLRPRRAHVGSLTERRTAARLIESHRRHEAALVHLVERFRPDFLFCVLQELDQIQHRLWDYCNPATGGGPDPATRSLVERFFRSLDATLGRLVELFGERARFFIVSDHGFGPLDAACPLNFYLAERGFLKVDWGLLKRVRARRRMVLGAEALTRQIGAPIRLERSLRRIKKRLRRGRPGWHSAVLFGPAVDWSRTRACVMSHTDQGITVNLKGRFPQGIVEPGEEYERVIRDLTAALEELVDPETGRPLVTQVLRREEVHHGPRLHLAPDLYVVLRDRAVKEVATLRRTLLCEFPLKAWHRMEGVLVAAGPGIRTGQEVFARITDVAPTVLAALGLPVPRHMDGRCLTALFEDDFLAAHPVRREEAALPPARSAAAGPSPEEEHAVREQLRRLGYL